MMTNCKHATELMSQALDRPLTLGERLRLRFHLLMCLGCRRTQAQFRFMHEALRQHPWKI